MQQRATQFIELPVDIAQDRRWFDAVLIFSCSDIENRLAQLKGRNVPVVLIGKHPGISCVAPDDKGGGRLAAERMLARGHTRILHLTLAEDRQWVEDRVQGFRAALDHAGVPEAQAPVIRGEGSVLGGYRLMRAAWGQGHRPTAVFAATDEMAIGALGALSDLGVAVPGQVSVVGFDGFKELCPALASVAQDIPAIAHAAVSLALEAIDRHSVHRKLVPVTFLDGSTLGPAPKG
jgi:LacI family transcriptional regulator